MTNGNEYQLLWDDSFDVDDSIKMIDIQKGWLELNKKFVSEIIPWGFLDRDASVSGKAKKDLLKVIKQYQSKEDRDSGGYIETELIKRFLSPSPFLNKKFEEIQGPVSIRYISSNEYPQIFYLLGDVHSKMSTCTKKLTVYNLCIISRST